MNFTHPDSLSGSLGSSVIGGLFQQHRPMLRRLVASRLDRRLAGRVDPSDVVQEALADAFRRIRLKQWPRTESIVPRLKLLATQHVIVAHRRHLLAKKRSVSQEQELKNNSDETGPRDIANVVDHIDDDPVANAMREERSLLISNRLSELPAMSQTVVRLRFMEGKSLAEISEEVGISADAVSKRIMRSLRKLAGTASDSSG